MTNTNPETQDIAHHSNFLRDRSPKMCAPKNMATQSCRRAFHPSPTATSTSATPRPSASTSASPTSSAAKPTCASTTPIPKRKSRSTSTPSRKTSAGSASTGSGSATPQTTSASSTSGLCKLIKAGKAYVDDLTADEIRQYRGTLTEPGKDSPYRNRTVEENLDLFARMKAGEFPDGSRVLRAKIDMASPNLNMRDPVMYRILHATHHRTGDEWCIYPMYDYAHGQSDSIEHVTHSMCTLEFADHQPLYRWYIEQLGIFPSQQIEFDRLNLTYTLLSKRKLLQLVQEKRVSGWDDPRMPTLSGIRRRGFTPEAIRTFCAAIGASRTNGTTDIEMLEHFQRDDLNHRASRAMAVLHPLKLVIDNYPEGQGRVRRGRQQPRRSRRLARARCPSRASSTSSRTISAKFLRRSTTACRPARKCACATPTSSPRRAW